MGRPLWLRGAQAANAERPPAMGNHMLLLLCRQSRRRGLCEKRSMWAAGSATLGASRLQSLQTAMVWADTSSCHHSQGHRRLQQPSQTEHHLPRKQSRLQAAMEILMPGEVCPSGWTVYPVSCTECRRQQLGSCAKLAPWHSLHWQARVLPERFASLLSAERWQQSRMQ